MSDVLPQGWRAEHHAPWSALTDEANEEGRFNVSRISAPFCDKFGIRQWSGPTLEAAMRKGCEALGLPLPVAATPEAPRWISVKDRLPEIDYTQPEYSRRVNCLVCASGKVMEMSYATNSYAKTEKGRAPRWEWMGRVSPLEVTHWMPMPAPPGAQPVAADKTLLEVMSAGYEGGIMVSDANESGATVTLCYASTTDAENAFNAFSKHVDAIKAKRNGDQSTDKDANAGQIH